MKFHFFTHLARTRSSTLTTLVSVRVSVRVREGIRSKGVDDAHPESKCFDGTEDTQQLG